MKKILTLLLCLLIVLIGSAQIPPQKVLVAHQTWVAPSGQSSFRVITSNDAVDSVVSRLKTITRYTALKKSDRWGTYWEHSYYFKNYSWNEIVRVIDQFNIRK